MPPRRPPPDPSAHGRAALLRGVALVRGAALAQGRVLALRMRLAFLLGLAHRLGFGLALRTRIARRRVDLARFHEVRRGLVVAPGGFVVAFALDVGALGLLGLVHVALLSTWEAHTTEPGP